ncbi:hypothetical protein ACCS81_07675 [Rhizobium ruizarguesonis]|jgi:hypothetical protein|uniref:Uncharacterized protein n=1 Tax=Rhizobium phage vB_RleA_TRX32-1 TaxID=2777321 RepID=A0A7T7GS72_9CAUD|nr:MULTISPECIES: hypothetical protein [Rhizobium]QQM14001.1 hypothetical protein [Rhizobium phage vB_RleA_TRX32-1]MBY3320736.1 hypothetical protein [Rhizobium laguerreae]MBY3335474.1 hypothetical protein [Rhizobium laguerreae]UIK00641.1 hypothetical protein LZK82_11085 [Rhizobium leguminosarum]UIK12731.1 hypothetical protein LZK80_11220 [Rhizobium leguminosarum]
MKNSDAHKAQSALGRAIELWNQGREISFQHGQELREDGYDVAALRRFHFKLSI